MSFLSNLGFATAYQNTIICILNDAKVLNNPFFRITTKDVETAKTLIKEGTFTLYSGDYGARCRMDIVSNRRRMSEWASFYEGDWNKDIPVENGSVLSEDDKKRLVLLFKDNGEKTVLNIILADEEFASIDEAIETLKIK